MELEVKLLLGAVLLFIALDSRADAQRKSSGSSSRYQKTNNQYGSSGHMQMTRSEASGSYGSAHSMDSQSSLAGSSKASKASAPSKASKTSAGAKSSPFSKGIAKVCGMPQPPMSGRVQCTRSSTEQRCTGQCSNGYEFPDGASVKELVCYSDGTWSPGSTFPDCQPICDPTCQNDGVCVGSNKCLCADDYWGQTCDIPRSICNIQENRVLSAKCSGNQELWSCTISCPVGMQFQFPPASVYHCNTAGTWDPSNIPSCISETKVPRTGYGDELDKSSVSGASSIRTIEKLCGMPQSPMSGSVKCTRTSTEQRCTGQCSSGYEFPDKAKVKNLVCYSDGTWAPSASFPDCEPICDPDCQNGGVCVGSNRCLCAGDFWGQTCDIPRSVCNIQENRILGAKCNGTQELISCTISCPVGMHFQFQPASVYQCNTAGKWEPSNIPSCTSENMIVHNVHVDEPHPTLPTGVHAMNSYGLTRNGHCVTWSGKNFQTFDGKMYSFEGSCTYLFAKDCDYNTFAIYIDTSEGCASAGSCSPTVYLHLGNDQYTLKRQNSKPSFFWGSNLLPVPIAISGIVVERVSHYLTIHSKMGFKLLWDGQSLLEIEIEPTLQNKTCGLCGRYDGSSLNDLETLDGHVTSNVLTFADSWKMNNFQEHCPDTNYAKDTCAMLPADVMSDAQRRCMRLKNPEYATCLFLVDPEPYIEACITEYCSCYSSLKDCGCTSISVYFKECQQLGGKLHNGWRRPDYCDIQCPNNMKHQDCGSICPPTCANPGQECTADWCVDGCFCPKGMLIGEGNKCYKPEDCSCMYQNKEYPPGSTVQQDCNNCMCVNGHWQCSQEVCAARCSSIGDPHYITFDGKHYDFMGKCSYFLVSHSNFSVEQENVPCDGSVSQGMGFSGFDDALKPSCTKTITIRTPGSELHMKQDYMLVLNGRELNNLPKVSPGMYIYMASSTFIKVELVNGLSILWDGKARLYIDASPNLMNNVQGLCGTFSLTQKDDFKTSEGDVEINVNAFANKWKTDDLCEDVSVDETNFQPCVLHPQLQEQARDLCAKIRSNLFADCHKVVDPEPYFHNCMYDMCSCKDSSAKECFCPTISDYAAACAKKGSIVEWRKEVQQCEISCHRGQVLSQCGSSCRRSCKDIAYNPQCDDQCVEGCNCPAGLTLNSEGECIPVAECSCFLNDKEYPAGYVEIRNGQTCECSSANWNCRIATPEELKMAEKEALTSECAEDANMEVTDCLHTCPVTCSNYRKPSTCQTVNCKPGCQCKNGFVLDQKSKQCLRPSECPCHHNDRSYKHGETMQQDCNICLCDGGQWKCEERECPGICSTWGENHIKTFDGRMFEFKGECEYTLAKGTLNSNVDFTINIQNMPCGSSDVTCLKSATFIIGGEQLHLAKGSPLPQSSGDSKFLIRKVGLFIVVHTDIGITLYWDEGTRLYIKAQAKWKEGLAGLCGDFNGNEMNDFRSPLGGLILVQPSAFANSWKVHSFCPDAETVVDNCEINSHRQAWAAKKCGVLTSETFRACHSDVPVEPFLERCISDTCACDIGGDCECTCTAIAAYAQECSVVGKPIIWRSQELCPIQCRTCDSYVPCMSVCPPSTCETKFLYKELADVCKQEMCVEGCEPPPCSTDEIFKDDKHFECIPKAECNTQPCKVINGVRYHEGERISDPTVAKPCQSCHCINGEVDCVGVSCEESTPANFSTVSTISTTVIPIRCTAQPHWSAWINSYTPTYKNGGDYEILTELAQGPYKSCPLEYITAIECRTVGSHELASAIHQIVHCNLPVGLMCENDDQKPNPLCRDYEVRLYCDCEKRLPSTPFLTVSTESTILPSERPLVTCTAPGWTTWMKNSNGYADSQSLRDEFSFCGESEILNVECRHVGTKMPSTLFHDVTCTKNSGLTCFSDDKGQCLQFEVRFYCRCKDSECDAKLGVESGAISDDQITASSSQSQRLGARLNGQQAWSPTILSETEWLQIELEEQNKVTGVLIQGNPVQEEWITHFEVEYSIDGENWNTIKEGGEIKDFVGNVDANTIARIDFPTPITAKYVRILPTDWNYGISLRVELLGCNPLVEPTFTTIPSPSSTPFPSQCVSTGWTKWMNADSPENNLEFEVKENELGDHEITSHLRYIYSFCDKPNSVRCREVGTNKPFQLTGKVVSCDVNNGLKCANSDQDNGLCLDYEISFFCECEEETSPTATKSTTLPTRARTPLHCEGAPGYTDWMSASDPINEPEGDVESFEELRSKYEFCKSEHITSIECRTVYDHVDYRDTKQNGITCDVENGFRCKHSQQTGEFCQDYEVRFYCLCKEDVGFTTEGTVPTEVVKATGEQSSVATVSGGPLCATWLGWNSLSTPGLKEAELMTNLMDICPMPLQIQCREVGTLRDYTTFTDLTLSPNCTLEGIVCDNIENDYNCPDFEINVLCECPTTTVSTPLIPIGTIPPVCNPGWTEWFDIDNPDSGGGDFERLEDLRQHYAFCKKEEITDVRCEVTSKSDYTGGNDVQSAGGSEDIKCNVNVGLECFNALQPSGRCADYQVSFYCTCEGNTEPVKEETAPPLVVTEPTTVVTGPPIVIQPICNEWTDWLDSDATADDIEEEFFSAVNDFDKLCPIIKKVECVEFNSELPYDRYSDVELDEACTYKGIRCSTGDCPDFKIRAYCECEGITTAAPICVEGWTEWLDVDDPHTDGGDFETMVDLRSQYELCSEDQITEVECRSTSKQIDYKNTGDYAVKCNKYVGVACYNNMQNSREPCQDYEIRFYCSCGPTSPTSTRRTFETTTTLPPSTTTTLPPSTTTTLPPSTTTTLPASPCPEGSTWNNCAYNCGSMCHSLLTSALESGDCPAEYDNQQQTCIPACIKTECNLPKVWRDKDTCVTLEQCTCSMKDGRILKPGEVVDVSDCERCHCLDNDLICEKTPNCITPGGRNRTYTTPPGVGFTTSSPVPTRIPIEKADCWTLWVNEDTPDGYGDSETFERLRARYEFCDEPVKIECRVAATRTLAENSDENAVCNLNTGLKCQNSLVKGKGKKCSDYEVRFYCPCENVTTPVSEITTPVPKVPEGPCVQGFTDWFSAHEPDEDGEYEQVTDIRYDGHLFCANEHLTSIQCREKYTGTPSYETQDRHVVCNLQEGFSCKNSDQIGGRKCSDFEVRYLCDCPTTYKPISTTRETEQPPVTPSTVVLLPITTLPPPCAYWSRWINDETPQSSLQGDFELVTEKTLQTQEKFCLEGQISSIECVDVKTGKNYDETEDEGLTCDVYYGFSCLNEKQKSSMCRDYKIRYYCSCEISTTTAKTTGSTPLITLFPTFSTSILIPTVTSPGVEPCSELVPILTELPDENFKASSSLSSQTGPHNGRLHSSSAWSAKDLDKNQFLQIDLGSIQPVYGIITQGHETKNEWVKLYQVMYSRDGLTYTFAKKKGSKSAKVFIGNYNNYKEVRQILDNPFEARFIRIQPLIWNGQISIRVEILGCAEITTTTARTTTTTRATSTTPTITVYGSTAAREECTDPMGFKDYSLSDDQITVSSARDDFHGPSQIRLDTIESEKGAGGWMAETLDNSQFVEIDFTDLRTLTAIETQGRYNADQYVTTYTVQYSNDRKVWFPVLSETGDEIFPGNYDSDSTVTNNFNQPIRARYLRINPQTWHSWISMRLEIKGCYKPYERVRHFNITTESVATTEVTTPYVVITKPIECTEPMGIENGNLDDWQITVSSSLNGEESGASRIRLNLLEGIETGGWLAKQAEKNEYVQFDFLHPVDLTGVVTQGRQTHDEWVQRYVVLYSLDGLNWENALNENGEKGFDGNKDGNTPVTQYFNEMISARYVRIQPTKWHNWISMRVEILGCYSGKTTTSTTAVPITSRQTRPQSPTTKKCVIYGEWVNSGKPYKGNGDYEFIDDIIAESNLCTNPIEIECREVISQQDYRTTGQTLFCDLTHGLQCKHEDQKQGKRCFDYEARIGCYTCEEPTTTPTVLPPIAVCPEVPERLIKNCPLYCPTGDYCDGKTCVQSLKCPCYVDGKKYYPGDRIVTDECKECECQLDGYSTCKEKTCLPCANGLKSILTSACKCECESCKENEMLCETSNECISERRWCDGVVDCPDDEKFCTTTVSPTCPPVPTCFSGSILTVKNSDDECPQYTCELVPITTPQPLPPTIYVCDVNGNLFKTFDEKEYQYDICNHILVQEKTGQRFNVTIHRECDDSDRCSKYVEIVQDSHYVRLNSDLSVEYNYQQYSALQLIRLGKNIDDFSLRIVGDSAIFKSKKYGFEVEWNKQQTVKVKVGEELLLQINGLCGLFSKNAKDDFELPSNQRAKGVEEFGNSWATGSLEDCEPKPCSVSARIEAIASCNNILLPPLSSCNEFVNPEYYVTACVASMCECLMESGKTAKECECDGYLNYVEACKQQTSSVKINEWRTKLGCTPSCPPGLVWKDCGSACERTCDNLQEDLTECSDSSCIPGCFCPEGTVRKRNNTCVPVNKCQDCVCDGYGDPHYNTFDRAYYPFQGNCTYVLARDKAVNGKHKFEVYVTNDECKEEPGTTCTTAIMVLYNDHIVHFRINESVTFDGMQLRPSDFPLELDGINVTLTGHPGRTVIITIDEIFLEVRYSESNYGFQVRLPSEVYFSQTEGLCGDCDHEKSNDMRVKGGVVSDNVEEFGLSWLATPPEGMEVVDENCLAHPPKPCLNNTEQERCNVVLGHAFKPCHLLVDPEMVLKACRFDVCHSEHPEESLCRSLSEYARLCAQAGQCIQNWRTPLVCPVNCAHGMYYDQCGPACQISIKNKEQIKNDQQECDLDPVEGCFCLGDKILHEGECRSEKELDFCDDRNHTIGDEWENDACTKCTCTEALKVECTKDVCPPKPICKSDETLKKISQNEETCCDSYYCIVTPPVPCLEPEIPTCAPEEIAKPTADDNNCVKYYTCFCDVTRCPIMQEPTLTQYGQEVVIDKSGCCPKKILVCNKAKCRAPPKCRPGEYLETYNNWKCCPEQHCVPPMDQCYYNHIEEVSSEKAIVIANGREALYEAGDSWMDGKCIKCRCDGSTGHYNALCERETCSPVEQTMKDNYVIEEIQDENKCCPNIRQTMCLVNSNKYKIGDTWPSPDGDKCKLMQCARAPSGDAVKTTVTSTCNEECPRGHVYEQPEASSPDCCGSCKRTSCSEGNKLYQVGETWNSTINTCAHAQCIRDDTIGTITQYSSMCPPFPENCPADKIVRDANNCCDVCTEEELEQVETCTVHEMDLDETIQLFQVMHKGERCTNKGPVIGLTECLGKCESHSVYSAGKGDFESTCLCCTPQETQTKIIELDCTDGSRLPFTLKLPTSCTCNLCTADGNQQPGLKFPPAHFK